MLTGSICSSEGWFTLTATLTSVALSTAEDEDGTSVVDCGGNGAGES